MRSPSLATTRPTGWCALRESWARTGRTRPSVRFRVEVIEGLRRLRVVLERNDHGLEFDLMWERVIPAQAEPRHFMRQQERVIFDSVRLAQTGRWTGHARSGDREFGVTPARWRGSRDRSRGVRPVGEGEPPGIQSKNPAQFYWMYAPMQFDDFSILTIVQEDSVGNRILEEAVRVWPEHTGRPPQPLGRPEYHPRERRLQHRRRPARSHPPRPCSCRAVCDVGS
jgi:hypothetical protein